MSQSVNELIYNKSAFRDSLSHLSSVHWTDIFKKTIYYPDTPDGMF